MYRQWICVMKDVKITMEDFKRIFFGNQFFGADKKAIINRWELDRGAQDGEQVLDITDKDDFKALIDRYGISTAVDFHNRYLCNGTRYVLGGSNFEYPQEVDNIEKMFMGLKDEIFESAMAHPHAFADLFAYERIMTDIYTRLSENNK